ncbi:diguanylate cyclase [Paludibaculum fermentans]|uniref:Diguanylate cyclase n=1 Tax=Paludibaculum fermentans TaxID=1473598 RepID=A0A7S7NWI4_PALFE|nr:HD domain-containing phosphohydrolase [Paludibaculum fermentans]QOY91031.1 diguanylate cyclase [Paludibaculum fermentans]
MTTQAKIYIGAVLAAGCVVIVQALATWQPDNLIRLAVYVAITLVASGMKLRLPGVTGTISLHFLFLLIGIVNRALPEVLIAGAGATLVQCFWNAKKRPTAIQLAFNVCATAVAVGATDFIYHLEAFQDPNLWAVRLGSTSVVFFFANTAPVALVIGLTEQRSPASIWRECYFWCFPYYLVGATLAASFGFLSRSMGEFTALLGLPVVYVVFRAYGLYLEKLEAEKDHAKQMASLHLRTIEALALAIDAKDHSTHGHLHRVQIYSTELGREMGLGEPDLEALHAAALLHDIGKLAVPEHIISKPGKLTFEEFEKMKVHPEVGADILERVKFPYPVVPIVRSHHEKWDGTGYPYGLKGEEIPLAARILATVDCLDALASERQYRRALPLGEALKVVVSESGKSYDPQVVALLVQRMDELEAKVQRTARIEETERDPVEASLEPGETLLDGQEVSGTAMVPNGRQQDFLASIAAARQEAQSLYELAQNLGNSLSLKETMSVMAGRLKRMVPYDGMAVYVRRGDVLKPEYVGGEDSRIFGALAIPMGQGLSGWVAQNRKPILNGNPSVEPGYLNDPKVFSILNSALAVPLETAEGVMGVLALYKSGRDAFSKDHLRVLMAVSSKISIAVENAIKYKEAESSATTDYLTALPNARSLFVHLDQEMTRVAQSKAGLAVLVCDIDGFKQVNDLYGHLAGNEVLSRVAARFRAMCRDTDYVARMGGDEFVVVAPGLSAEAAVKKIVALDQATAAAGAEACGCKFIGLSVGVSFFPADGQNAEELLAEADRRMYRAKQARKKLRAEGASPETIVPSMARHAIH